jgi:hypothetical protein
MYRYGALPMLWLKQIVRWKRWQARASAPVTGAYVARVATKVTLPLVHHRSKSNGRARSRHVTNG